MARFGALAAMIAVLVSAAILPLPGAAAPAIPPKPCELTFPPATISGQTLLALSCNRAYRDVTLTLPRHITNLSKYAIVSGTSLVTGTCSGEQTMTATCHLGAGFQPGSTLLLQLAPRMKIDDRVALILKGGRPATTFKETIIAFAGPKLTVKSAVTPDPTTSVPAGTAFDFSETVSGGSFFKLQFNLPPGNSVLYTLKQPTNDLQCGAPQGASFTCFEQGTKPVGPGTFQFAVVLTKPIPTGTTTSGEIWGNGLHQGTLTVHWYGN